MIPNNEPPHGPHPHGGPHGFGEPAQPYQHGPWRGPDPWGYWGYYPGRAFGPWWVPWYERAVPQTDDQLPLISHVGRGIQGNGFRIDVDSKGPGEIYLIGKNYDPATKTWTDDWTSPNISGGSMLYQYNLRDWTDPKTFTITFKYRHPGWDDGWVWTTPAIPYTSDGSEGGTDLTPRNRFGSLFLKKTTEDWLTEDLPTSHTIAEADGRQEKLLYPDGWDRDDFNAPLPGEDWTINIEYGIGGDIDVPNTDNLAKILGLTPENLEDIVGDVPNVIQGDGIDGDNVKDYIDDLNDHIHRDMGFADRLVGDDGTQTYVPKHGPNQGQALQTPTIKQYIDARCDDVEAGLQEIVNHIVGVTINPDGSFNWPDGQMIAIGDINLYSGIDEEHFIRTHEEPSADHDVKAV